MAEQKKAKVVEVPPEYWWVSYFREDIQEIRGDIKRLDDKTEANINKLDVKIEAFRKDFKEDINKLDVKIEAFRKDFKEDINRLDGKIEAFRKESKEDINRLDGKIDNLATSLRKEMAELRRSLITWLFAGIGFLAVLITILKFVG